MGLIMRARWRALLVGLTIAALVFGLGLLRIEKLEQRTIREFGHTPGLFTTVVEASDETWCERIEVIGPKAHYNFWGEIWQDSYISWEQVQIRGSAIGSTKYLDHGRMGPMKVGDILCGFSRGMSWEWIYEPDGTVMFARSS